MSPINNFNSKNNKLGNKLSKMQSVCNFKAMMIRNRAQGKQEQIVKETSSITYHA